MTTLLYIAVMLCFIVLPTVLSIMIEKKPIVYKQADRDTSEARYAINERGYLEEIAEKRVKSNQAID